jgi:hypothetical protein
MYNWNILNDKKCNIIKSFVKKWDSLLKDKNKNEQFYQKFLSDHAGLFFGDDNTSLIISKLKLGCDYETDFVLLRDDYSNGILYELIEIESPHSKPFNKTGEPSARLTKAIQQIHDWKDWLLENRNTFSRLFPNDNKRIIRDSSLRYKIIIGTRENSSLHLEKRNQLSNEIKISIRSFDSVADYLRKRPFKNFLDNFSSEINSLNSKNRNDLANPFYKAINDGEWRNRSKLKDSVHYTFCNNDFILSSRRFNILFDNFKKTQNLYNKN